TDSDADGVADADDLCPEADDTIDSDADGTPDCIDNCPQTSNPDQLDTDNDSVGDACEQTSPGGSGRSGGGFCGLGLIGMMPGLLAGLGLIRSAWRRRPALG
ncbi:MAG: hypothetical protein GTO03_01050, partial [Planctomycetales bacterium]|nr:hypothetical protein [Planctomycetales bacterium]